MVDNIELSCNLLRITQASSNSDTDAGLSALLIQSYIHKKQGNADRAVIAQVDSKIREDCKKSTPFALCLAAMVLLLLGKLDKAKEYSDRAYKLNPVDTFVLLAKGWCSLTPDDLTKNPGWKYIFFIRLNL